MEDFLEHNFSWPADCLNEIEVSGHQLGVSLMSLGWWALTFDIFALLWFQLSDSTYEDGYFSFSIFFL